MEATAEGLAAAAAARQALKQKKRALEVRQEMQSSIGCFQALLLLLFAPPSLPPPPALRLLPLVATEACVRASVAPPRTPCLQLTADGGDDAAGAPAAAGAAAKKASPDRPPPSCTHEVAVPPDYDVAAAEAALDPALHGARLLATFVLLLRIRQPARQPAPHAGSRRQARLPAHAAA